MMEERYHSADPFRWHLNAFLKALKEVPQIVQMELQNLDGFPKWYTPIRDTLANDQLIAYLGKSRDNIVHKGMLIPNTRASLGVTEGRGMKLGLSFPLDPLEDSDAAMKRYLAIAASGSDFLGILIEDEDSRPCVYRRWALEGFEPELVDLCAQAWLQTGQLLDAVLRWLGEEDVPSLSLGCRHGTQAVRYKTFNRALLIEQFSEIKSAT